MAASVKNIANRTTYTYSVICTLKRNICNSKTLHKINQASEEDNSSAASEQFPESKHIDCDWVGPADKLSSIRRIKFHVPQDETSLQKKFREEREKTQEWHHQFWTKHNQNFTQLKEEFIKKRKAEKVKDDMPEEEVTISAEEMSEFYKKFLDENFTLHRNYNREWYKKNAHLLWLAFRVNLEKVFAVRKSRKSTSSDK